MQDEDRQKLTIDEKYDIASTEAEYMKNCVDDGKKKSDEMIETLKVGLPDSGGPGRDRTCNPRDQEGRL